MKKNTTPYLILTLLHIGLFAFTAMKRKNHKPFHLLFVSIGLSYIFEFIVLNVFRSYRYYPKVFKNKWTDSMFGAIISQAFLVPVAATAIALFRLGTGWRVSFTFFFVFIERLFLSKKLFTHFWWRTIYTGLFLPIFFWIIKKWSILLEGTPNKWIASISLFFAYWVNYINIYFLLVAVFKQFLLYRGMKFFRKKYWEHFILAPIYTSIQAIIATITTRKNIPLLGIGFLHVLDRLLYKFNLIKTKTWSVYYFLPIHFGEFYIGGKLNKRLNPNPITKQ